MKRNGLDRLDAMADRIEKRFDKLIEQTRERSDEIIRKNEELLDEHVGKNSRDLRQMVAVIIGGAAVTLLCVYLVVISVS